jgi:hypothetical protein
MKTYYSDKLDDSDLNSPGILLFLPDIKRELSQYIKRDIADLEQPFFTQTVHSYLTAHNSIYNNKSGLILWKNIIKSYYELIDINLLSNKHQKMYELYAETSQYLSEGQHDLFLAEEQLENNKNSNREMKFKLYCDKYHILYESCLRYSITPFVWCLDNISGHKDKDKNFEELIKDDLSYKIDKINKCTCQFFNSLSYLKDGAEPLIRNSIAHKTFEYLENNKIKFVDRKVQKEYDMLDLITLVDKIQINYLAQVTALTLFAFDNIAKVDSSIVKKYRNDKQLRIRIDTEFRRFSFIPKSIDFKYNSIICTVEAPVGYDRPHERGGTIDGKMFMATVPPLDLRAFMLQMMHFIAGLQTKYQFGSIYVFEKLSNVRKAFLEVNLSEWTNLYNSKPTAEELGKNIIGSSFTS